MVHLVYCDNVAKELSKFGRSKTMIIRGASGRKIRTVACLRRNALFYGKGTKKISAKARVTNVLNYVKLTDEEITAVIEVITINWY